MDMVSQVAQPGVAVQRAEQAWERLLMGLQAQWRCALVLLQAGIGPVVLLYSGLLAAATVATGGLGRGPLAGLLGVAGLLAWPLAFFWWSRQHAAITRSRAAAWSGLLLREYHRSVPGLVQDERGHWWTGHSYFRDKRVAESVLLARTRVSDPATWRDVRWLAGNAVSAGVLALPSVGLLVGGGLQMTISLARSYFGRSPEDFVQAIFWAGVAVLGLLVAPHAVRMHSEWACRLLDPESSAKQEKVRLTKRVEHLTTTRADAVGSQVAELRRIERDLHDGAQARLVAIGMTLGTIEHLMETDPSSARSLLAEARQSSARALQELRDLVRGIHPPVLAERGLGDAVRELALDSALPVEVTVSLPARPEPPVESAAYFCVSELLANAAKHSGAGQVWVDILFRAGQLRISVTDDGRGGAAPERGSGLRGIERRLATFDGVFSLSSPLGGPTTITMELPCVLSSPRTSTSSERV
ncbi:histidine kinase [Kitasatospora sp. MMS16-BH015]|uniref:sensor histidine kinase n=1 Tax=Kitasatospora sp. MMS16-BH015 TaxID=2018025 RepID=UPI000CA2C716|nr:histidine kinase [Kitasatospora sp. MMS16-BH015]AUG77321.1 histidine kinase [Kitasatospora sp. MMS16-BH015]